MDGFWEVFDTKEKVTVYVSDSKPKAVKVTSDLQKGVVTVDQLK
jgi:hypothetical protein